MTLQASGAISLSEVEGEFGGSSPISMSEYYTRDDGIPTSGTISMSDFYSKSAIFYLEIASDQINYSIATAAAAAGWISTQPIEFTIPAGIFCYNTSDAAGAALKTGDCPAGLTIICEGYICGSGGSGGVDGHNSGYAGGRGLKLECDATLYLGASGMCAGGGGGGGGQNKTVATGELFKGGGGGGAGGGNGGEAKIDDSKAAGGAGGGPGNIGSSGSVTGFPIAGGVGGSAGGSGGGYFVGDGIFIPSGRSGGGGGGFYIPSTTTPGSNYGGTGGSYSAGGSGAAGGGGGGWGAAGGDSDGLGGDAGRAIDLNGYIITRTGTTANTYGAIV